MYIRKGFDIMLSPLCTKLTVYNLQVLYYYGYPKYGCWAQPLPGFTIYLYCELWVSYYEWSYARQLEYTPVSSNSSLYLRVSLPFFLRIIVLFLLSVLSRIANPLFLILFSYLQARISGGAMITPPYQCEWGSNSIISKWTLHREGGSGIGTDSHLQKLARQRCSQRHYRAAKCKASSSNNSPDQVRSDRGVCLRYSSQRGLISTLGPKLGPEVSGLRLKVRSGDGRWARLPGPGARTTTMKFKVFFLVTS